MFRKRLIAATLATAASACAAGLLASPSSGGAKAQPTIGLVRDASSGFYDGVERGAKAASTALGDQLVVKATANPKSAIQQLVAQHVDAIAVDPGYAGADLTSALTQAKKAGIATVSYDRPTLGSVWIHPAGTSKYAHALADTLATQMGRKGRYAVVPCRPGDPIVTTWLKGVNTYIPKQYPHMKRVAVAYGDDSGSAQETNKFRHLIIHRRLRGLIALCPTEAAVVPRAITEAGKVGKVFAAGNGGADDCPPLDPGVESYVRSGAEEVVCSADPAKLGYLTAWAENYLASGHTFKSGPYRAAGPVGSVRYHPASRELRLNQPLTITKANIDQYAGG
jgi:rhamnose transport system substrate-binding protein